uniref:F-box domain-containing protein n=1 Tax=Lutzomyia longipalpis TaxID=7200 RepID=A0A1B0GLA9_LUTLO
MDNKATSDSPTTIYDLPHNALVRIGRFLNWFNIVEFRLCSRKCKEMAEVMLEKGLKEISLSNDLDRDVNDDPNQYTPIRYCTKLRKCEFTSMNLFKDKKMHQFLSNNPHLKEVSIRHMRNTTTAGILPLANCMNLSKLTLVCVPIDDQFLRRLTRHKIHLVEVELTHLKITVRGARDFFRAQPLLEKITLAMRHDDIRPCLLTISKHCPKLKSLDIHNANLNDDNECAL